MQCSSSSEDLSELPVESPLDIGCNDPFFLLKYYANCYANGYASEHKDKKQPSEHNGESVSHNEGKFNIGVMHSESERETTNTIAFKAGLDPSNSSEPLLSPRCTLSFARPREMPPRDPTVDYYEKYCEVVATNIKLHNQLSFYLSRGNVANTFSNPFPMLPRMPVPSPVPPAVPMVLRPAGMEKPVNFYSLKEKRTRTPAWEVDRKYKCMVPFCSKGYGSERALNNHVKLKHPELYYTRGNKFMNFNNPPLF